MASSKKRFIFLLSHPIQYFSPMFVEMAKDPDLDLLVLYCSDENIKGHIDKEFGVEVKWDIPLLEGYNYKFLKNNSWKASIFNGFFGLINFDIFRVLKKERNSFLVIHSWNYATNYLAVFAAKRAGLKLCLRAENPLNQELLKSKQILFLRKIFFKYFFFKLFNYFFYIGRQNKMLYEYYGVKENRLIFTPYAVHNDRFRAEYEKYKDQKTEIREKLGLPIDKIIVITSGKYINKKRPFDLLNAYKKLNTNKVAMVFLGDGELRNEMQDFICKHNLNHIYLTGFKNQSDVGKYFAAADIFVLPSGAGETWGLVVNEAMNFALPIIISDLPGSGYDLVKENENGFTYRLGDIEMLKSKLELLIMDPLLRENFAKNSFRIINNYSYLKIIANILDIK